MFALQQREANPRLGKDGNPGNFRAATITCSSYYRVKNVKIWMMQEKLCQSILLPGYSEYKPMNVVCSAELWRSRQVCRLPAAVVCYTLGQELQCHFFPLHMQYFAFITPVTVENIMLLHVLFNRNVSRKHNANA